jgi:hypothetical protein
MTHAKGLDAIFEVVEVVWGELEIGNSGGQSRCDERSRVWDTQRKGSLSGEGLKRGAFEPAGAGCDSVLDTKHKLGSGMDLINVEETPNGLAPSGRWRRDTGGTSKGITSHSNAS